MIEANFALQWLDYLGNEIYNNGKRIFEYKGKPNYEISKLKNEILIGQEFIKKDSADYSVMPYSELQNYGFTVVMGTDFKWREKQTCYYAIKRKDRDIMGITESLFKRKLQLQYDPINRKVRLAGEDALADKNLKIDSGLGPWITYDEDSPIRSYVHRNLPITKEEYRSRIRKWAYGVDDSIPKYQEIKELPVMISDENYVVCIRKEDTCQRIIIVGESGKGKSLDEDSLIPYLQGGEIKVDKIKDIEISSDLKVMTLSGWSKVKGCIKHEDNRERIKITTRTGKTLIGTPDHSFIVMIKNY